MHNESQINVTIGQSSVQCYGQSFPFPPRGHDGHYDGQKQAVKAAKKHGIQLLDSLEAKKGARLTDRERITGRLELKHFHRPLAERMATEAVIQSQREPSSNDNPHRSRLDYLESRDVPISASERAQLKRRIQQTKKASEVWEAEKATSDVDGGRKWWRGGGVAAVEIGGAHACSSASWEDGGRGPDLAQIRREAQECVPTWSSGKRCVGEC